MTQRPEPAGDLPDLLFNRDGLIPVIVQQYDSGEVLMMAWMNQTALELTLAEQRTVFWSRSRSEYWRKGEISGHTQRLVSMQYDCDGDVLLAKVDQFGVACHTGTRTCFDSRFIAGLPATQPVKDEDHG